MLFFTRWWLLACLQLLHAADYCVVFVHIGATLPPYLPAAISQARLFNPDCPIYLLANEEALRDIGQNGLEGAAPVPLESLPRSELHERLKRPPGFWRYTTERFYYLEEFVRVRQLRHVFHLENDVMLYRDLRELLPIFQEHYAGEIAGTFDNDSRCVGGFLYAADERPLSELIRFAETSSAENDMYLLGEFRRHFYKRGIDHLPIVLPAYSGDHPLKSLNGRRAESAEDYSHLFDAFGSLFDAAAFGQYVGGLDPIHEDHAPRFINESCIFNPAHFAIAWERDAQGRQIPFVTYQGQKCQLNNLHVHCKDLRAFSSLDEDVRPIAALAEEEKTRYPLVKSSIDVAIYATEKEQLMLEWCIESLRTHNPQIGRIWVIAEKPLTDKALWCDERLLPFSRETIADELLRGNAYEKRRYLYHPRNQLGAIFASLARLYAPQILNGENLLVVDPRVVFLGPLRWQNEEGGAALNGDGSGGALHAAKLLPAHSSTHRIDHFVLLQRPIWKELFQELQAAHQTEPWRAFCRKIDKLYEPFCCDFSLYGSFALAKTGQVSLDPCSWIKAHDPYEALYRRDVKYLFYGPRR